MSHGQMHDLTVSLQAVHNARSMLDNRQAQGTKREASTWQQLGLLSALESYAATLGKHGHPVPHRMRTELAMYRALATSPKRPLHR